MIERKVPCPRCKKLIVYSKENKFRPFYGLSDLVSSDDMGQAVARNGGDLARTVEELIDLANERGGKDNITVVLARVEAGEPPRNGSPSNGNGHGNGHIGDAPAPGAK